MNRYSRVILYSAAAFLLTAGLTAGAQTQSQQQAPDTQSQPPAASDGHSDFPPGEGRELTMKVCSTCHQLDVVAEQRQDLDGWKMTVDQMASMGAEATEAQLDQIVKYLAKAFPPESK
jgi:mono/diheme cytochrome c family protein